MGGKFSKCLNAKFKVFIHPILLGGISFCIAVYGVIHILQYFEPNMKSVTMDFTTREEEVEKDYEEMLPDDHRYTLVSVQDEENTKEIITYDEEKGINEIGESYSLYDLVAAQEKYPKLKINKMPTFLLIDKDGKQILKVHSVEELHKYLMNH